MQTYEVTLRYGYAEDSRGGFVGIIKMGMDVVWESDRVDTSSHACGLASKHLHERLEFLLK